MSEAIIGGLYKHLKSGGEYIVTNFAVLEKDLTVLVIYQSTHINHVTWARPRKEFEDGRFELMGRPG